MHILVLNGGSSSIKFSIFDAEASGDAADPRLRVDGELEGIGGTGTTLKITRSQAPRADNNGKKTEASSVEEALRSIFRVLDMQQIPVDAVGYRVVHPGPRLKDHQLITESVLHEIEEAIVFAPLHNPDAAAMIRAGQQRFPNVSHYACFDTVFHQTMPVEAFTYPLPYEWREAGVRRYGFHGISCEWIMRKMRAVNGPIPKRTVIAHLGSGCSITAVVNGVSIDTTMGFTPTGGIVMGTRPGDLDPGVLLYLLRHSSERTQDALAQVESELNHKSGLVALSGQTNDMRAIRKASDSDDKDAQLALKVFVRSITKAIGGYCWLMGGVDAIVFTGGIGEHDARTREDVLASTVELGITIDSALNAAQGKGFRRISSESSKTAVFVIPVEEDCMIAVHVSQMSNLIR